MSAGPAEMERLQRIESDLHPAEQLPDQRQERATIAELMERHLVPGCSLAIIDDGDVVAVQGYGTTEQGTRTPVTATTIFQACSISKAVAAVGVMRLVQEGTLALDEDINSYLLSWRVPPNGGWQPTVTLRHLLTHTAGLTYCWFPGYQRGSATPSTLQTVNGEAPSNTPSARVV